MSWGLKSNSRVKMRKWYLRVWRLARMASVLLSTQFSLRKPIHGQCQPPALSTASPAGAVDHQDYREQTLSCLFLLISSPQKEFLCCWKHFHGEWKLDPDFLFPAFLPPFPLSASFPPSSHHLLLFILPVVFLFVTKRLVSGSVHSLWASPRFSSEAESSSHHAGHFTSPSACVFSRPP